MLAINFTGGDVLRDREAYKEIAKSMMADSFGLQLPDSALDYLPDPALRHRSSLIRVRIPGELGFASSARSTASGRNRR